MDMTQTSTTTARQMILAAEEAELRATVAALSADYLSRIGLGSTEAVEAYIAAEMADEAAAF